MPDDEAAELLIELYKWQTRDEFVYRHVGAEHGDDVGQLTMHRATGGFEDSSACCTAHDRVQPERRDPSPDPYTPRVASLER